MKVIDQFKNKKVLVLGLAKSGESAARLLDKLGAIVTVNDGKPFRGQSSQRKVCWKKGSRLSQVAILWNSWMKSLPLW